MNICFITTAFIEKHKTATGLPMYLYRVSRALIERGHNVDVIAISNRTRKENIEGIAVYYVKPFYKPELGMEWNYFLNIFVYGMILNNKLRELEKVKKIDIVQYTNLQAVGLCSKCKAPTIMRLSSYAKACFANCDYYKKSYIKLMTTAEMLSSRRMNGIISPSRIAAEKFSVDTGRHVTVIESPFVLDIIEEKDDIYKKYLEGKKYVLYFGSIQEVKGLTTISNMIFKFLKKYPDFYYVFVGDKIGKEGDALLKQLFDEAKEFKNRIIYIAAQQHERLYPIIRNAQIVTMPSLMDNFPNGCVEAMYLGKIVIGTRGASFEQLITNGANGFLCEIGDGQGLLQRMEEALQMKEADKRRMENRAEKRIQLLRPEIAVERLLHYYHYIIMNTRK